MARFLILCPDRPGVLAARLHHRHEHIDYWREKHGAVLVAGAMLRDGEAIGSMFLLEAGTEAEVRALVADDPFTRHDVFTAEPQVNQVRPAIGAWLPPA